jgi:hypothetical protein
MPAARPAALAARRIIANTVTFTGTSNLSLSCAGMNINPAGNQTAVLVE